MRAGPNPDRTRGRAAMLTSQPQDRARNTQTSAANGIGDLLNFPGTLSGDNTWRH